MDTKMRPKDFKRYLAVVYFGTERPGFRRYIDRAYRDFNRTLHTADSPEARQDRVEAAAVELSARLTKAAADKKAERVGESAFDGWHDETCDALISVFGGDEMSYGHAQKWLNMSLKYLFSAHALKLENIGQIGSWYPFAHLPVDNVVLEALAGAGFVHQLPVPWSKLTRDQYLDFERAVRKTFKECPMDVEFMLWRASGTPTLRAKSDTGKSDGSKTDKKGRARGSVR
ncbi:MAG: hypothetical protein P4L93_02460 [Coriobacteriia bacterium]|nr:hypothetical protein [Coriobacteriia bacterium]